MSHQALASSPCLLVEDEQRLRTRLDNIIFNPQRKKKHLEGPDFVPGIFPSPLNLNSVNLFIIYSSYMR